MIPAAQHGYGSGSGTTIGYVVEARTTYSQPVQVGNLILDAEWRRVPFDEAPAGLGVRAGLGWCRGAQERGLMDFAAATTLACMFTANADHFCTQMRLVRVQYDYEYTTKELGVGPAMSLLELERSAEWTDRMSLDQLAEQAAKRLTHHSVTCRPKSRQQDACDCAYHHRLRDAARIVREACAAHAEVATQAQREQLEQEAWDKAHHACSEHPDEVCELACAKCLEVAADAELREQLEQVTKDRDEERAAKLAYATQNAERFVIIAEQRADWERLRTIVAQLVHDGVVVPDAALSALLSLVACSSTKSAP